MSGPPNAEALYALFEGWYQQRQGDLASTAVETIEITLPPGAKLDGSVTSVSLADLSVSAKRTYENRRLRDRVFQEPELFGEPVWDMLLDVASAEARGACLSVTSACIGSCVAETTALRWLKMMEVRGLICRAPDPCDGRRSFVRLTEDGRAKLELYFAEIEKLE